MISPDALIQGGSRKVPLLTTRLRVVVALFNGLRRSRRGHHPGPVARRAAPAKGRSLSTGNRVVASRCRWALSTSSTYEVIIRPTAQRALRCADRPIQLRLVNAMDDQATDPRPHRAKVLQGHRGLLRVRVGDYCIVYEIRDSERVVFVVTLGHRSKVYDRL